MKLFSSEYAHAHEMLIFGYCNYCEREEGDSLTMIYQSGYLPYSGSPSAKNLLYMARSARLYLPNFTLDSECRRIAKKFDGMFTYISTPISELAVTEEFIQFWLAYYDAVHSPGTMPRERLLYILQAGFITHVVTYFDAEGTTIAHVFEVQDNGMVHIWYTSYALSLIKKSFGMWLMLDAAQRAQKDDLEYFYAGTAYGKVTDYKANFPNLEYWDGTKWTGDAKNKALKERSHFDTEREFRHLDQWKEEHPIFTPPAH